MKEKRIIKNSFFDLISIFISFIFWISRSILTLIFSKKIKKNYFFDILDFLFRIWPRYFWEKPSIYKITNLIWDFINYVFYNQNISETWEIKK